MASVGGPVAEGRGEKVRVLKCRVFSDIRKTGLLVLAGH